MPSGLTQNETFLFYTAAAFRQNCSEIIQREFDAFHGSTRSDTAHWCNSVRVDSSGNFKVMLMMSEVILKLQRLPSQQTLFSFFVFYFARCMGASC